MRTVTGLLHGLCLAGCLFMLSCGKPGPRQPQAADRAQSVQLGRAQMKTMERSIPVTGTLAAQERSTLSAKVSGRLQEMAVDVGSVVRRDEIIARIEPRDYELRVQQAAAALAQARAALGLPVEGTADAVGLEQISAVKEARAVLEEATKNLTRMQGLSAAHILPQSELDTAEATHTVALTRYDRALEAARGLQAQLAQRRAEHEIARKQLEDTAVRAPYDGAVQARPAGLGEYLDIGAPIVLFVKADPLRLKLEVPERESILVSADQPVRLRIEGDANTYTGRVARISPALDETSRMLLVEADVPQSGSLRPGLFARGEIVVNNQERTLSIPENALVTFAGLEKVIGIHDGKAVEKTVRTGRRSNGWVEILSGLQAGEDVVLEPGGLRTGRRVTVAPSPAETSAVSPALSDARPPGISDRN